METRLPARPQSVRVARAFVVSSVSSCGCEQLGDVAELLVSEMVTNAVVHGDGEVAVRVLGNGECVRVEVDDRCADPAVLRHPGAAATSGRGMMLVSELADRWGNEAGEHGKTVWFELAS